MPNRSSLSPYLKCNFWSFYCWSGSGEIASNWIYLVTICTIWASINLTHIYQISNTCDRTAAEVSLEAVDCGFILLTYCISLKIWVFLGVPVGISSAQNSAESNGWECQVNGSCTFSGNLWQSILQRFIPTIFRSTIFRCKFAIKKSLIRFWDFGASTIHSFFRYDVNAFSLDSGFDKWISFHSRRLLQLLQPTCLFFFNFRCGSRIRATRLCETKLFSNADHYHSASRMPI